MSQTNSTRPWDRRSKETTKAHAAFRAYIALGARRSVREAARQTTSKQHHSAKKHTGEHHRAPLARLVRQAPLGEPS